MKGIPIVASVHDTNVELMSDSLKKVEFIICVSSAVKIALISEREIQEEK